MNLHLTRGLIAIFFIASLFVAIFLILKTDSGPDPGESISISKSFLKPYPLPSGWKQNPSMSNKYSAYTSYSIKDYPEAMVNFKYAIVDNPADKSQRFYLGICQLMTSDPRESIREFNYIIEESGLDSLVNPAKWYKSLALIDLKRMDQALRLLSELDTEESRKLLNELSD